MAELKTSFQTRTGEGLDRNLESSSVMSLQFPTELGTASLSAEGNSLEHFVVFYVNTMQNDRYFGPNKKGNLRPTSSDSPIYQTSQKVTSIETDSTVGKVLQKFGVKSWKRTQMMIALPMPLQITKSYSANWTNITTSNGLADDLLTSGFIDKLKAEGIKAIANKSPVIGVKTGVVQNPRTEALFEAILPGNNNFEWTLYPKTPEESRALWNIIQIFKWAMLPDIDENELFFDVPNTVDVEYWTNGERNDWLPRSMTSYIRNVSVNYCPAGHWVALNLDRDGNRSYWPEGAPPLGVTLTLDLGELTALDKRMVDPDKNSPFTFGKTMNRGTL